MSTVAVAVVPQACTCQGRGSQRCVSTLPGSHSTKPSCLAPSLCLAAAQRHGSEAPHVTGCLLLQDHVLSMGLWFDPVTLFGALVYKT